MPYKNPEKQKQYNQSDKRKAIKKRYQKSDKGKNSQKRHFQSDKGKAARKRFNQSDKGKTAIKKHLYNITLDNYKQLLKEQNEVCVICSGPETRKKAGKVVALSIDHNHETGKVRGLLCNRCNIVLGMVKEDINILAKAIIYLNKQDSL